MFSRLSALIFFVLTIAIAPSHLFSQEVPACMSAGSDSDGDGWGWENNTSCLVETDMADNEENADCIDSDGDGYGWNGVDTCLISTPAAAVCVDSDGDGFGWNGFESCRVGIVAETECIDEDGDGFGWNGISSCTPGVVGAGVNENASPTRITLGENGNELNDDAYGLRGFGGQPPAVSGDGRYILFDTFASNVVGDDTNDRSDVFLRNIVTGNVRRVSQGVEGEQANNHSSAEAVSASGRFSVYTSFATNLVDNNARGGSQLYLYDADAKNTELISLRTDLSGVARNSINAKISTGGGDIVYESNTGFVVDGVDILHYTVSSRETRSILTGALGDARLRDFSSGDVLYFKGNGGAGRAGYFNIYNIATQTTEQLPLLVDFWDDAKLSGNARYVIFTIDGVIYLLDRFEPSAAPSMIRRGTAADISSNGRWMIYTKQGTSPDEGVEVAGVTNLFVQDLVNGNSYLLSTGLSGAGLNDFASLAAFSGFDNAITFITRASNLIDGDNNNASDVYLYEIDTN